VLHLLGGGEQTTASLLGVAQLLFVWVFFNPAD
jgi:hypothetical protein